MTKREILMARITEASESGDWQTAREEWALDSVYRADEPEVCLCTHTQIIEICIIRNRINGNVREVGNCCVKNFIGLPSQTIFDNLRRISTDKDKGILLDLARLALRNGWINDWEYDFCLSTGTKRALSYKQAAMRRKINDKVLRSVKREAA